MHLAALTALINVACVGLTFELARHGVLSVVCRTCLVGHRAVCAPEVVDAALLLLACMMRGGCPKTELARAHVPAYVARLLCLGLGEGRQAHVLTLMEGMASNRILKAALLCTEAPRALVVLATKSHQARGQARTCYRLLGKCCLLFHLLTEPGACDLFRL